MMYFKSYFPIISTTKIRLHRDKIIKLIGVSLLFFSFSSASATQEQIHAIQAAAEHYILQSVEQPIGGSLEAKAANIDSRVFTTDCPAPLEVSSKSTNSNASNITVLVECHQDDWRLYIPVRLTRTGPQVALVSSLSRGQIITAQDVTTSMVDLQRLRRQGFSTINAVIGAKVKKNLRAGEIIEQRDICVVCRNDIVTIKAVKSGMTITTKGVALSDGSHGEQIKVKNSKSNRIIDGKVTDIAEVTVIF
ncbi:flagellar basal body P-ring formation protein FlgA [Vibrio sp. 404]|uniref:Flagella basal body P-ring formation protein FlgA n=1 Tax=Vibrio marinisediminis TaxID=2758441 RepID=A0A7W2FSI7_9VIBR|nr:flagellar basal body P-ring formation chaperone FlgA [Vibrio marinisediminis]MBA5763453.1 flagellar basal body P-ring formation protein FlgA [Vibrio marinisediminis]